MNNNTSKETLGRDKREHTHSYSHIGGNAMGIATATHMQLCVGCWEMESEINHQIKANWLFFFTFHRHIAVKLG